MHTRSPTLEVRMMKGFRADFPGKITASVLISHDWMRAGERSKKAGYSEGRACITSPQRERLSEGRNAGAVFNQLSNVTSSVRPYHVI